MAYSKILTMQLGMILETFNSSIWVEDHSEHKENSSYRARLNLNKQNKTNKKHKKAK